MSYARAAVAYREQEIRSATPGGLVVIIYDHLLANLRRAGIAIEKKDVATHAEALAKAGEAVMELLVSTDVEKGGQLAQNLRGLYAFIAAELIRIGMSRDLTQLNKIIAIVTDLRNAFATIANEPSARVSAA